LVLADQYGQYTGARPAVSRVQVARNQIEEPLNGGRDVKKLICAIVFTVGQIAAGPANAQNYPTRPVTIVVPYAAGGPTDVLARILAERMGASFGQPVLIENVIGAGGSIGLRRVVRATPDGYTIGIGNWGTHVGLGVIYRLDFDLLKDFEPVALLPANPMLIVTKKDVPAYDLRGLTAWLRANEDKISVGTSGVGGASHVAGVFFQGKIGAHFQFIPYRGAGPAMNDLVAGQIVLMVDSLPNSLQHVRSGAIKAFAVTAGTRTPLAPEIPTVDEAGAPGLYVSIWNGLWVPRATPKDVVAKLNAAAIEAMADPIIRRRLGPLGYEIPPSAKQTPEALGEFQRTEIEKWWPIIKAANIKGE
jgi:tripartite-type tricarboxylate transporter receptor subunit TctC